MKKRVVTVLTVCVLGLVGLLASVALPVSPASAGSRAVTVSGVFVEVHGDSRYADETLYFLKSGGREYQLKTGPEPKIRSGSRVTVQGTLTGDTIDVRAGGSTKVMAAPAPMAPVLGTQSVLVINVVWPGASLTASAAQEENFMFGTDSRTVASYYSDASYGKMTWTGTETPSYTITDPAVCNLSDLANQAEAAATAGGYNISSYKGLMINAPDLHCAAVGYGEIGGNHTWIQDGLWNLDDGYSRLVPTHEIGHSLGLYHSHGLECGGATVTSTCLGNPAANNEEYGNAWDVMGNNWPGDSADAVTWFSAKQEMLLGWLSGSQVQPVTTSGTYTLVPLEKSGTTSPQVLVLTTASHKYYVEYRQPISQDAFLSGYPSATNSVHVNVSAAFGSDTGPFALDFTPDSNTGSAYSDWFDAPLAMGGSFTDPENTFTLSPITQNGTTATVQVTFTGTTAVSGGFTSLTPSRLLDTRTGVGTPAPAAVAAGATVHLQVTGRGGVPASGVSAVVLNVTATAVSRAGYVSVFGDGTTRPGVSNLNLVAGRTVANLVITPVGADGKVALYNGSAGTIALIADVSGYYKAGAPTVAGAFGSLTPSRLLDTRTGVGAPKVAVAAHGTVHLQVTGRGGVPASGVSAVVLNVTVTAPTRAGHVTVYGDGTTRPGVSNLNFVAGQTVPNLVIAPVGAGGKVALYNGSGGTIALIADVSGHYKAGAPLVAGTFGSLAPSRLLDTRSGVGAPLGAVGPGATVHLQVTGRGGVPASGVSAVVLNVTATAPTSGGHVTVYGDGTTRPGVSNLNFVAGQTVPNLVIAPVGAGGKVALYNGSSGTVQLLGDVSGYDLG